jgi:hypothetical protein
MLRLTRRYGHAHEDSGAADRCSLSYGYRPGRRYGGSPGHPADATPVILPPKPNSLFKRGVGRLLREPLAGTTVQTLPGTLGHLPAWFSQFRRMNRSGELGVFRTGFRLTSEGSLVRTQLRPPGQRVCSAARSAHGEPSEEPYRSQDSRAGSR